MTIDDAMTMLDAIKKKNGNIDISFDCPFCGKVNKPTKIELGPPLVIFKVKE